MTIRTAQDIFDSFAERLGWEFGAQADVLVNWCSDEMPYFREMTREEVREQRTWLRLGRLPKTSSIVLMSDSAGILEPKPMCWSRPPATEGDLVDIEIDDVLFQELLNEDNFGDEQSEVGGTERPDWQREGF